MLQNQYLTRIVFAYCLTSVVTRTLESFDAQLLIATQNDQKSQIGWLRLHKLRALSI